MKAVAEVRWDLHLDPAERWRDTKANVEFVVDLVQSLSDIPDHVAVSGFLVKADGSMGKARRINHVPVNEDEIPDPAVLQEIGRLRATAKIAVGKMTGGAA